MEKTITQHHAPRRWYTADRRTNERLARGTVWLVIVLLAANQFIIGTLIPRQASASPTAVLSKLFGAKSASAAIIVMPRLNPDGTTTSLVEQPTISEVPADPKTGDAVADAKTVMLATGSPFYAPDGISFSDPINAENLWGAYETGIQLSGDLQTRYDTLTTMLTCNYCCGEPGNVTRNKQCGCAHAKGARGFFKYMLQTFGEKYTNDQLMGEAFRWQAIWYPKGAVEDYLLATGKGSVIGHATHGGAGADGMHGLTK